MTRRVILNYDAPRHNQSQPSTYNLQARKENLMSPETHAEEPNKEEEHKPLFDAARKVLLAGIGVVALAQDEIEDFVTRMVERGEIAERDGKKLVREVMDKRKHYRQRAEEEISKRIEKTIDRMNMPTKADIDALSEKIAALSKKIDELKKTKNVS
jgi:polyhydroxyalkanoate synthesis regulator phasin